MPRDGLWEVLFIGQKKTGEDKCPVKSKQHPLAAPFLCGIKSIIFIFRIKRFGS